MYLISGVVVLSITPHLRELAILEMIPSHLHSPNRLYHFLLVGLDWSCYAVSVSEYGTGIMSKYPIPAVLSLTQLLQPL